MDLGLRAVTLSESERPGSGPPVKSFFSFYVMFILKALSWKLRETS